MPDQLTKALLLEEVASTETIGEALFASVTRRAPLVQTLLETGAVSGEVLERYLARSGAPFLRNVAPIVELVEALPPGLCERLRAVPVRRDPITGTIDVVVADPSDPHPGQEIAFHLEAPVRLVRATPRAIEEALLRSRARSHHPVASPEDDRLFDSRPRAPSRPPPGPERSWKGGTQPPPGPSVRLPGTGPFLDPVALGSHALRPSRVPLPERPAPFVPGPSAVQRPSRVAFETPPWGTLVHGSEPPHEGLGSEIPIPLTRRAFGSVSGGTQRPPPLVDPQRSALGEGYAVEPGQLRQIVEVNERPPSAASAWPEPVTSFIPGPPPLPGAAAATPSRLVDRGAVLSALRAASSRDEVLALVLAGARMVAAKVALFVAKRNGYVGWACTPELAGRAALMSLVLPLDGGSVLEAASREGMYLGPLGAHDGPLDALLGGATRDVAAVPIRVAGKTAVVVLADDLGETMLATRRLEELASAAGDAFTRLVRARR